VRLTASEPLAATHELAEFSSGVPSLADWLKRRARANQVSGATRTFVVAQRRRAIGYYAIASSGVTATSAVGRALFRDCAARVLHAADTLGIRGIVVHAISEPAKVFYLALGSQPSPLDPMTLMVTRNDVRAALGASTEQS